MPPLLSSLHISACHEYGTSSSGYIIKCTSERSAHGKCGPQPQWSPALQVSTIRSLASHVTATNRHLGVPHSGTPFSAYLCNISPIFLCRLRAICRIVTQLNLYTRLHASRYEGHTRSQLRTCTDHRRELRPNKKQTM
jgi:hypothetical protein